MAIALRWTHLFLSPLIVFLWSSRIPVDSSILATHVGQTIVEENHQKPPPQPQPIRRMYLEVRAKDKRNRVYLKHYICEQQPEPVTVECKKLYWKKDIKHAYLTANFFIVSGLRATKAWAFAVPTKLPYELMIGVDPDDPIRGLFENTCFNFHHFEKHVNMLLVPEFLEPRFIIPFLQFYCINDLRLFSTVLQMYETSAQVYVQTLKNVIDFYEHPPDPASRSSAPPTPTPSAPDPDPSAPNPSAPARTTILSKMRSSFGRRLSSMTTKKEIKHSGSSAKNSKKEIQNLGSSAKNSMNQVVSRTSSVGSTEPENPRYISPPSPRDRLPGVVQFLMEKMIDPCIISKHKGAPFYLPGMDPDVASNICNVYCKFLSIAAALSTERGRKIEACKQLDGKGKCHEAVCSCQLSGTTKHLPWGRHGHTPNTPMLAAHNILRFK